MLFLYIQPILFNHTVLYRFGLLSFDNQNIRQALDCRSLYRRRGIFKLPYYRVLSFLESFHRCASLNISRLQWASLLVL